MITKELVAQWAKEAHVLDINQALHRFAALSAAHGAAQRDAELLEPIGRESLLGAIARGWCHEANANKSMDEDLANAIAKEVDALYATQLAAARLQGAEDRRDYIEKCTELEIVHDAYGERITALETLVTKVHAAKGRYHTQLAVCDLYDAVGLSNERPKK